MDSLKLYKKHQFELYHTDNGIEINESKLFFTLTSINEYVSNKYNIDLLEYHKEHTSKLETYPNVNYWHIDDANTYLFNYINDLNNYMLKTKIESVIDI